MRDLTLSILLAGSCFASTSAAEPNDKVDFARDVLPILSDKCFLCHGPDEATRKGDLRLDRKEDALRTEGVVIVPGDSATSEIIRRIVSTEASQVMPPRKSNRTLTPAQIATLKRWIDEGAAWGQHWAFVAPVRPKIPGSVPAANPIDAFVHTKLKQEKLAPSPEATREQLLRRATLDLTGLPPTLTEVEAFLADRSPEAYEKVVDRLLASPRFGERLAWDWLDAARYADTNGYQGDSERTMWPWRDWVVRAFNANMPYDRFTIEQLAGDLLPNATKDQILATAFNRNHMINGEGGRIAEENRIEYGFDQTETTGTVWLGLTLTCTRCHDHKFDPITKSDYFRLFAYFDRTPVTGGAAGGGRSGQVPPILDLATPEQEKSSVAAATAYGEVLKKVTPIEKKLRDDAAVFKDGVYSSNLPAVIESALRKGPGGRADTNNEELITHFKKQEPEYVKHLTELRQKAKARDAASKGVARVMVMQDLPKPRQTFMLTRGAYDKLEGAVTPGVPASLPPLPKGAPANRLTLANWLVSPQNPLTARVTVNRYWQMLFGVGLVKTSEDFGVQGERPVQQELLDWLACEFQKDWDLKRLLRLVVTSATYRQSSKVTAALHERDPENRLLARGSRHRLPSWMIRDQALAASGLLTSTMGGEPVKTYQPPGIWEEATFGNKRYQQDKGDALYRRSLYVYWRRIVGPTLFFDTSARQTCTVKSVITNTPLHALATLNDVTYVEAARALAQNAMKEAQGDAERLAFAFRRVTARKPTDTEARLLAASLEKQRTLYRADKDAALKLLKMGDSPREEKLDAVEQASLTATCLVILNLDESLSIH